MLAKDKAAKSDRFKSFMNPSLTSFTAAFLTVNKREVSVNVYSACMSVTRDMSGFRSTRSVRFSPEGSHAAGGQNGPDHRCDWVASSEEVELRGGGGAVGDERAALSPAARCL